MTASIGQTCKCLVPITDRHSCYKELAGVNGVSMPSLVGECCERVRDPACRIFARAQLPEVMPYLKQAIKPFRVEDSP